MLNVMLSEPVQAFPETSVPTTVADTIPLVVVEIVHGQIQTSAVEEAVIATLDTSPVMLMVGVTAIASLKVAVMVNTFDPETILSESVSVKATVGRDH